MSAFVSEALTMTLVGKLKWVEAATEIIPNGMIVKRTTTFRKVDLCAFCRVKGIRHAYGLDVRPEELTGTGWCVSGSQAKKMFDALEV